ncbi:subtilisin inhibitor CLSI-I-like [Trifolium pratense]|uniref:subtilisin inhibitor CLSI-I-like n=1 Tax=Trifolium pratense TaxID=57577 RepID=UPI001E691027|nr:subtilisin inhibitor CLSI-I-like [Trifolium pratense]
MAEEKQGNGINPPQVKPNEPLPRTYNQLLVTNNRTKTSWPELVGATAEEAERKIKEEISGAEVQVVPPDSFVTADYRTQRVRLYVDESNKVIRTPGIG